MSTPDSVYDNRPYNLSPKPYSLGPNPTTDDQLLQRSLDYNTAPGAALADSVRPPLAQVPVFRPRLGYRTRALTIEDVVDVGREFDPARITWWSGGPAGYSGTSRNTLGDT